MLAAVVSDNLVISANVGDCRGLILSENGEGLGYRKINHKLNASSRREQVRLRKEFPDEQDIIVCRANNPRAWYVKNRLQPTRALGDFELKHAEFTAEEKEFRGPYITHLPEIMRFELQALDRFLLLASDGLWDELTMQ